MLEARPQIPERISGGGTRVLVTKELSGRALVHTAAGVLSQASLHRDRTGQTLECYVLAGKAGALGP